MKKGLLLMVFLCFTQMGLAQIDTTKVLSVALTKANLMSTAFQSGDYETFLDLTHPKIIGFAGGRDKMKELLKQGAGPGVEFLSMEFRTPSSLIAKGEIYQCSFIQKQVLSIDGQKMYTLSSLIGISYNSGKSWTFIGVADKTLVQLLTHFPELSDKLELINQTPPILIND